MSSFFDKFPLIPYQISGVKYSNFQTIRNLLFRTSIIREALSNSSSYMRYIIQDGDTPEILASKIYGDPEAHWMILYANDMLDAQYDWPLTSSVFPKYIADKYRSMAQDDRGETLEDYEVIAWTQDLTNDASVHHYEKVVIRENQAEQITEETRFKINKTKLTNNALTDNGINIPHDYYEGPGSLAAIQDVTPTNLTIDGQTIIETVYGNAVTYYDYENELNEAKRTIQIIKKEYYNQINAEFDVLANRNIPTFMRRVS
jgi:subtilisin family serine protease